MAVFGPENLSSDSVSEANKSNDENEHNSSCDSVLLNLAIMCIFWQVKECLRCRNLDQ